MKRLTILLSILFLLPILSSCCKEYYMVVDVDIVFIKDYGGEAFSDVDEFAFLVNPVFKDLLENSVQNELQKLNSVSHALSCASIYENYLLKETFSLSFDKSFQYKGTTILAGENLLHNPIINQEITMTGHDVVYIDNIYIKFSDSFLEETDLSGCYIVTFLCKTSNDLPCESSTTIYI